MLKDCSVAIHSINALYIDETHTGWTILCKLYEWDKPIVIDSFLTYDASAKAIQEYHCLISNWGMIKHEKFGSVGMPQTIREQC